MAVSKIGKPMYVSRYEYTGTGSTLENFLESAMNAVIPLIGEAEVVAISAMWTGTNFYNLFVRRGEGSFFTFFFFNEATLYSGSYTPNVSFHLWHASMVQDA